MSRRFRFYEKKRGDRRTVPQALGSVGEALFFGFFLIVGCAALWAMLAQLIVPEWRANRHFAESLGTIVAARVESNQSDPPQYRPEIEIEYQVDGQRRQVSTYDIRRGFSPSRELAEGQLTPFRVGEKVPCWYDPLDPSRVVLVRGYSGWLYVILLVPISFIAIGGGRLVYTWLNWGTSAERRAVMAHRASQLDVFDSKAGKSALPGVPGDADLKNSPGTRLKYRLPIVTTAGWALFAILMACLLWNGIVLIFLVMAIRSHLLGQPDWSLTVFVLPFLAIGIGLLIYLVKQLLTSTGVGATRIEISEHPLLPGEKYEIFVSQAGRVKMNALRVYLVCEERATYRQGTDTRTETRLVYRDCLLESKDFEIEDPRPFEKQCVLSIPPAVMHSFRSDHNAVEWKLMVVGDVSAPAWRGPAYDRSFPIVVYPPQAARVRS